MSARQIRGQLADARAMEEQSARENMHGAGMGRYVGAGHFVGAGGVPSMGTSQFRGGRFSYGAMGVGARGPRMPYRGTNISTAIVPYRPPPVRGPITNYRPPIIRPSRPVTTVATRPTGTIKPYNPAEAAARLRAMKGPPPKTPSAISSRLRMAGITAAAVAAAIGLGIGMNELIKYFEDGADPNTGAPPGTYVPPEGDISIHDDPNYPGGGDGPYGPGGDGGEKPWWSYTQNIRAKDLRGRGMSDGRSARAAIVRQVMNEQGLGLIEASRYVKENGLY